MAMVKCKECSSPISDQANSCPHCGCPDCIPSAPDKAKKKKSGCIGCLGVTIAFFVIALFGSKPVPKSSQRAESNTSPQKVKTLSKAELSVQEENRLKVLEQEKGERLKQENVQAELKNKAEKELQEKKRKLDEERVKQQKAAAPIKSRLRKYLVAKAKKEGVKTPSNIKLVTAKNPRGKGFFIFDSSAILGKRIWLATSIKEIYPLNEKAAKWYKGEGLPSENVKKWLWLTGLPVYGSSTYFMNMAKKSLEGTWVKSDIDEEEDKKSFNQVRKVASRKERLKDILELERTLKKNVEYVSEVKLIDKDSDVIRIFVKDNFIRQDKLFKKREFQAIKKMWVEMRKGMAVVDIYILDKYGDTVVTDSSGLFNTTVEVKQ